MTAYSVYNLDFSLFNLSPDQFARESKIHGIKHTYRVMLHCLRLGMLTGMMRKAKVAFFGAYIHDMARTHDGYCTIHGAEAARKLPAYKQLFNSQGATDEDLKIIAQIVTRHSLREELPRDHAYYDYLAILKDADALDRIRLGRNDLNPSYLRIRETHECIRFAEELYYLTDTRELTTFTDILALADHSAI